MRLAVALMLLHVATSAFSATASDGRSGVNVIQKTFDPPEPGVEGGGSNMGWATVHVPTPPKRRELKTDDEVMETTRSLAATFFDVNCSGLPFSLALQATVAQGLLNRASQWADGGTPKVWLSDIGEGLGAAGQQDGAG